MPRNPAFNQGRQAFVDNVPNNPHKEGTIAHKEFTAGYDHQYFLNLHSITNKDYTHDSR